MDKIFEDNGYVLRDIKPIINGGSFDNGYYYNYEKMISRNKDNIGYTLDKEIIITHEIDKPSENTAIIKYYWYYDGDNADTKRDENIITLDCNEIKAIYEKLNELGAYKN